jgi:two-component system alkaline phosphatase synthesis response regulator PhoP
MIKVLLVDDERCLLEALSYLLSEEGFQVVTAFNGREALDLLATAPVDVVISDIMMPVMDGWQLLEALRGAPSTRDIPVILMTAAPGHVRRNDSGTSVLRKPFGMDVLLNEIRRVLPESPDYLVEAPP